MTGDSYDCGKNGLYAGVREVWTTQPGKKGQSSVKGIEKLLSE